MNLLNNDKVISQYLIYNIGKAFLNNPKPFDIVIKKRKYTLCWSDEFNAVCLIDKPYNEEEYRLTELLNNNRLMTILAKVSK